AFRNSTKIRHRITHPKIHSELDITDEEVKIIDQGLEWWSDIYHELLKKRRDKLMAK
ncbi:MAG: hypothetical protein GWN00_34350, partial [Aliifodinibius sp.]|nr:hypothetical protein [Fodinibius sp.]NIY29684.1 hypothetical protein [Fodinibius sp.]